MNSNRTVKFDESKSIAQVKKGFTTDERIILTEKEWLSLQKSYSEWTHKWYI